MKNNKRTFLGLKLMTPLALSMSMFCSASYAHSDTKNITLIEMGDLHGTIVSHQAVLKNNDGSERYAMNAGGLAKLKTVVDGIRADNPNSLLPVLRRPDPRQCRGYVYRWNQFGIDVFTPGNWDYGYGAAVFRNRFATKPPFPPLPANIQVMANAFDGPGVTKAAFPVVSANLYNDTTGLPLPAALHNQRILDPYKIINVDGVNIAVIGFTASIVPQQADTFNIGLRFTQGVEELPGLINEVKALGADIIVVQSELGIAQNMEIGRRFKDVDVVYSAHTHEVTMGALLADQSGVSATTPDADLNWTELGRLNRGAAIVVETNRDMYVGRLDLTIKYGKVVNFKWTAIPVDDSVPADPDMAALVAQIEEPFVAGADGKVERHTFMPGGYCPGGDCGDTTKRGLQLTEDLDTVVGSTDTLLLRHHVLEDTLNNLIADAILDVTRSVTPVDISMANGFRFGDAVLPGSDITLRNLYTWFPIAPAVNVADFSGQSPERNSRCSV